MAVRWDASGEDYTRSSGFPSTSTFSVCFWLILDVDRNTFQCPLSWDSGGGGSYVLFETDSDGTTLKAWGSGGESLFAISLTVGTWYFIAFTRNGTGANSMTEYHAAVTAASLTTAQATMTTTVTPDRMQIGASPFADEWVNGRMAAFKLWDGVVLTQAEIENERFLHLPHRTANLHSFYPFVNGGSVAAAQQDFSGNGRTLSGGTSSATADGPPIPWRQGLRQLTIPTGGGATVNADSRLTASSLLAGLTAVSKPSDSRLTQSSRQTGLTSVTKPSQSTWSLRTGETGLTEVAKVAESALTFSSRLLGLSSVLTGIFADARLAFLSFFRGSADVTPSVVAPGIVLVDDREMEMTWEDNRTVSAGWENNLQMDMIFGDSRIIQMPNLVMTRTGLRFEPVIVGDDFRVKRLYKNVPAGSVLTTAWFTVKSAESVPDVSALIKKTITTTPTSQGQITQADTSVGDLAMYFDPTRLETALASTSIEYVYDIQVKTTDDRIYTLEKGTIPFILGVTDAIS